MTEISKKQVLAELTALLTADALTQADARRVDELVVALGSDFPGLDQVADAVGESILRAENLALTFLLRALVRMGDAGQLATGYLLTELERANDLTASMVLGALLELYPGKATAKLSERLRQTLPELPPKVRKLVERKLTDLEQRSEQGELF